MKEDSFSADLALIQYDCRQHTHRQRCAGCIPHLAFKYLEDLLACTGLFSSVCLQNTPLLKHKV